MNTPSSWRLTLQGWIGLLILGLTLWIIITFAGVLLEVIWVLFAAILISLSIRPLANLLARRHIPRPVTMLGVYVGLAGILSLLGGLLVPVINAEIAHLQTNGADILREALARVTSIPLLRQWVPSTDVLAQNLAQRIDVLLKTLVDAVAGLGGLALDLLVVLVLAYFFATDKELNQRLLTTWLPEHHRPRAHIFLTRVGRRLSHWVWAQLAIGLYFAVTFSIGLTVLGVPFGLTIGLVGGILEIVPYLGGAIAFLLALLSAITVNPLLAVWVAVLYVIVTEIESHIVAPTFYGRVVGLHPATVLFALFIGAKVRGIVGVLFAVPIAVVLAALLQELHTILESSEPTPDSFEPKLKLKANTEEKP